MTERHLRAARRLGRPGPGVRRRRGAVRSLEERTREQLYELARRRQISGRSTMGKGQLIEALRRAR